jgi:hypothetical protein
MNMPSKFRRSTLASRQDGPVGDDGDDPSQFVPYQNTTGPAPGDDDQGILGDDDDQAGDDDDPSYYGAGIDYVDDMGTIDVPPAGPYCEEQLASGEYTIFTMPSQAPPGAICFNPAGDQINREEAMALFKSSGTAAAKPPSPS